MKKYRNSRRKPKNRPKNSSLRQDGNVNREIETIAGRHLWIPNYSASLIAVEPVWPGNANLFGDRLVDISNQYANYRFKELRFETVPMPQSSGASLYNVLALGYQPTLPVLNPSNVSEVAEMDTSLVYSTQTTIPRWMEVKGRELSVTNAKWLRTRVSSSYDDNFEFQGFVALASLISYTGPFYLHVSYVCELCVRADSATTVDASKWCQTVHYPLYNDEEQKELRDAAVRVPARTPAVVTVPTNSWSFLGSGNRQG